MGKDIRVLIKCVSEGNFLPYRELAHEVLRDLSPLKTQIRETARESAEEDSGEEAGGEAMGEGLDGFQKPRRRRRSASFQNKELIFTNITAILNGFEAARNSERK